MPGWPTRAIAGGEQLKVGDTLLVCDVGGGTTDFTLVGVDQEDGELCCGASPSATTSWSAATTWTWPWRTYVAGKFGEKGVQLDPVAIGLAVASLPHGEGNAARRRRAEKASASAVLGRGSKLIGGTVSVDLERERPPICWSMASFRNVRADRSAGPPRASRAFSEIGLPFESDTAITRHLAAFLDGARRSRTSRSGRRTCCSTAACSRPTCFAAAVGRDWPVGSADEPPQNTGRRARPRSRRRPRRGLLRLGQAAWRRAHSRRHGALVLRRHRDRRPGDSRRAAAAAGPVRRAVRHGGRHEIDVPSERVRPGRRRAGTVPLLQFGRCARTDKPGDLLDRWTEDELAETDSLEATLARRTKRSKTTMCRSGFSRHITELGVFELWCQSTNRPNRWKLEFSVRQDAEVPDQ